MERDCTLSFTTQLEKHDLRIRPVVRVFEGTVIPTNKDNHDSCWMNVMIMDKTQ